MLIREAQVGDADGIARVHVETWQTAYADILRPEVIASRSYQNREDYWRSTLRQSKHELVFVAERAGEVVGFASGGPERSGDPVYRGELYALYVLAEHQNHGVGRALVRAIAERLNAEGLTGMLVWVLAANAARHFYARLGGVEIRHQPIDFGTQTVDEVAYGWRDTGVLVGP